MFDLYTMSTADLSVLPPMAFVTNCHLTHLLRSEQTVAVIGFGFGVVLRRSYFWRQAQVCMSLARATDDLTLRQHYEDLALEFAQKLGRERDLDISDSSLDAVKPGGGNTSQHN